MPLSTVFQIYIELLSNKKTCMSYTYIYPAVVPIEHLK
jgi:hypothetical protein